MGEDDRPYIGPHDLGGRPAGAIDPSVHSHAYWERLVDALVVHLFKSNVFANPAQLQRGLEALDPKVYDELTYYERWAAAAAAQCVERGLVTTTELDERVRRIKARGYR